MHNGDQSKTVIANEQSYFAMQARRQADEMTPLCDPFDAQINPTQTDDCRLLEVVLRDALAPAMGETAA